MQKWKFNDRKILSLNEAIDFNTYIVNINLLKENGMPFELINLINQHVTTNIPYSHMINFYAK